VFEFHLSITLGEAGIILSVLLLIWRASAWKQKIEDWMLSHENIDNLRHTELLRQLRGGRNDY
jgi:hypothetical protein